MIIHIVRENERLNQILDTYKVSKNDIVSNNRHITDFNRLKAGMKLKIPLINDDVIDELNESEPFIEDYYNNKSQVVDKKEEEDKKIVEEINEIKEKRKEVEEIKVDSKDDDIYKDYYKRYIDYYNKYYKYYYDYYNRYYKR